MLVDTDTVLSHGLYEAESMVAESASGIFIGLSEVTFSEFMFPQTSVVPLAVMRTYGGSLRSNQLTCAEVSVIFERLVWELWVTVLDARDISASVEFTRYILALITEMTSSLNVTVTYLLFPLTPYTAESIVGASLSLEFDRAAVSLAVFDADICGHVMPPVCTSTVRGGVWSRSVFSLEVTLISNASQLEVILSLPTVTVPPFEAFRLSLLAVTVGSPHSWWLGSSMRTCTLPSV